MDVGMVWVPHAQQRWIPAKLVDGKGGIHTYETQEGERISVKADISSQLTPLSSSSLMPIQNLVNLEEFSEGAILHQLRMRYAQDKIYTLIGQILVSVNPYKMLPIYTRRVIREYRGNHTKCEPHVFRVAAECYDRLLDEHTSQAVIISGESGAGKTEATKTVLQYLSDVAGSENGVEQDILLSNPVLEAFGNAKTVRNNNSSRFGKWMEIKFEADGKISAARVVNYLLEKSRVCLLGKGERNYHVFYQMLLGLSEEEKKKYSLGKPEDYFYLSQSNVYEAAGQDDPEDFAKTHKAMKHLAFEQQEIGELWAVLSAILHVGNLELKSNDKDGTDITNKEVLETVASLLGLNADLLNTALTFRSVTIRGSTSLIPLKQHETLNNRNAFAKELYAKVFDWLVLKVNQALCKTDAKLTIGILDIFGFEIFDNNLFEQFCINFANEKLQQHFNNFIFKEEQAEYKREGIDVSHIDFVDNIDCLALIEGKQGIISMLDEELRVPGGSDEGFVDKAHRRFAEQKKNKYYDRIRKSRHIFIIKHYAGDVSYNSNGFLEKNQDKLNDDLSSLVRTSEKGLVKALFPEKKKPDEGSGASQGRPRFRGGKRKKVATLGSQFRTQLQGLMDTLNRADPHYIRCIKPNTVKKPNVFYGDMILRQMTYAGLFEAIRIRKSGFPVRLRHSDFVARYKVCLSGKEIVEVNGMGGNDKDDKDCIKKVEYLLAKFVQELKDTSFEENIQMGKTKVFMRNAQRVKLNELREAALVKHCLKLQAFYRGVQARRLYALMKRVDRQCAALLEKKVVSAIEAGALEEMSSEDEEENKSQGTSVLKDGEQATLRVVCDVVVERCKEKGVEIFKLVAVRRLAQLLAMKADVCKLLVEATEVNKLDPLTAAMDECKQFKTKFGTDADKAFYDEEYANKQQIPSSVKPTNTNLPELEEKAAAAYELLMRIQRVKDALHDACLTEDMKVLSDAIEEAQKLEKEGEDSVVKSEQYEKAVALLKELEHEEKLMQALISAAGELGEASDDNFPDKGSGPDFAELKAKYDEEEASKSKEDEDTSVPLEERKEVELESISLSPYPEEWVVDGVIGDEKADGWGVKEKATEEKVWATITKVLQALQEVLEAKVRMDPARKNAIADAREAMAALMRCRLRWLCGRLWEQRISTFVVPWLKDSSSKFDTAHQKKAMGALISEANEFLEERQTLRTAAAKRREEEVQRLRKAADDRNKRIRDAREEAERLARERAHLAEEERKRLEEEDRQRRLAEEKKIRAAEEAERKRRDAEAARANEQVGSQAERKRILRAKLEKQALDAAKPKEYGKDAWRTVPTPDGEHYYFNIKTNQTQWTLPYDLMTEEQKAKLVITPQPVPADLKVWKLLQTPEGENYYFNILTQSTSWDEPEDFDILGESLVGKVKGMSSAKTGVQRGEIKTSALGQDTKSKPKSTSTTTASPAVSSSAPSEDVPPPPEDDDELPPPPPEDDDAFPAVGGSSIQKESERLAAEEKLEASIQRRDYADLNALIGAQPKDGGSMKRLLAGTSVLQKATRLLEQLKVEDEVMSGLKEGIKMLFIDKMKELLKQCSDLCLSNAVVEEARHLCYATPTEELLIKQLEVAIQHTDVERVASLLRECAAKKIIGREVDHARDFVQLHSGGASAQTSLGSSSRSKSSIREALGGAAQGNVGVDDDLVEMYNEFVAKKGICPLYQCPSLRDEGNYAKRSFFSSKSKLKQTRLQWQKDVIPRSLVKLSTAYCGGKSKSKAVKKTAVEMFENIQGYMGDTFHNYPDTLAYEVIDTCVREPLLRDEVVCQLIKQTTKNPNPDSILRGFKLLYMCLTTFDVSSDVGPSLVSHCAKFALPRLKPGEQPGLQTLEDVAANCYFAFINKEKALSVPSPEDIERLTLGKVFDGFRKAPGSSAGSSSSGFKGIVAPPSPEPEAPGDEPPPPPPDDDAPPPPPPDDEEAKLAPPSEPFFSQRRASRVMRRSVLMAKGSTPEDLKKQAFSPPPALPEDDPPVPDELPPPPPSDGGFAPPSLDDAFAPPPPPDDDDDGFAPPTGFSAPSFAPPSLDDSFAPPPPPDDDGGGFAPPSWAGVSTASSTAGGGADDDDPFGDLPPPPPPE